MTVLQAINSANRISLVVGQLVLPITKKQARDVVSQGYRWVAGSHEDADFAHTYSFPKEGHLVLGWRDA